MRLIDADALKPDADYDDGEFWAYSKRQIEAAPTIEPERKKGKWEWLTEDKYRCSECGRETRVDECMEVPMYAHCPYCTADMTDYDGNVLFKR